METEGETSLITRYRNVIYFGRASMCVFKKCPVCAQAFRQTFKKSIQIFLKMPIEKADSGTGWNFNTKAHTQVHTPICKRAHTRMHMHVCTHADIHIHARTHTHTHAHTCTARMDKTAVPQLQGVRKRTQTIQTHSQMRSYKCSFKKKRQKCRGKHFMLCDHTCSDVNEYRKEAKTAMQTSKMDSHPLFLFPPPPPFVAVVISPENRQLRPIAWLFKYHSRNHSLLYIAIQQISLKVTSLLPVGSG